MDSSRLVLEVLKWLSPTELLTDIPLVNREWSQLSCRNEVWFEMLETLEGRPDSRPIDTSAKDNFRIVRCQSFLPLFAKNVLIRYYFSTEHIEKLPIQDNPRIDYTSVWTWLPSNSVFCAGSQEHNLVYLIEYPDLAVKQLPSMTQVRGWFGMIHYQGFVYVFGGFYSPWVFTKRCEKFDLGNKEWRPLPDMEKVRSSFNACRWHLSIFLAGGWENPEIEEFSIETETFVTLPFRMIQSNRTLSWVSGDELILLQEGKVYKWNIAVRKSTLDPPKLSETLRSYIWTNTPPVNKHSVVYFLSWDSGAGLSYDWTTDSAEIVVPNPWDFG